MFGQINLFGVLYAPYLFVLLIILNLSIKTNLRSKYFIALSAILIYNTISFLLRDLDVKLLLHLCVLLTFMIIILSNIIIVRSYLPSILNYCSLAILIPLSIQFLTDIFEIDVSSFISFYTIKLYEFKINGGGFANPNNTSLFIFILLLSRILQKKLFKNIILYELINALSVVSIFMLGSRLILFSTILILILLQFITFFKYIIVFTIVLFFIELNLNSNIFIYPILKYSTFFTMDNLLQSIVENSTFIGRANYIDYFFKMTWLPFGLVSDYSLMTAPHNLLIELSFTLGIVGFIFYFVFVTSLFYSASRSKRFGERIINFILIFLIILCTCAPSTLIFTPATITVLTLVYLSLQRERLSAIPNKNF